MYECHLTYEHVEPEIEGQLTRYAETSGWKTSFIDGDPALGPGKRFFLTCHSTNLKWIHVKMRLAAMQSALPAPAREKIERIVYDTKYGPLEI